jgi:hypothetical protein
MHYITLVLELRYTVPYRLLNLELLAVISLPQQSLNFTTPRRLGAFEPFGIAVP